jgi:hypothetical protein
MLYATPNVIALQSGASATLTLISTLNDLTVVDFTYPAGAISITPVSLATDIQTYTVEALTPYGTFALGIKDSNSTDTASVNVSVVQSSPNVPSGYTANTAMDQVRLRTNEPTLPVAGDLLQLLNAGVENIERKLGGIRLWGTYPTTANQPVQALTTDTQDIISCSWSTGNPTTPGVLVYPMAPLDQASFMDQAAGFPNVGTGPPQWFFVYRDQSNMLELQLYPAAMLGQLNVYYRARPQLFSLSVNYGNNGTNLDTSMQEALILWTCARVLENRGRSAEARAIFEPQLKDVLEEIKEDVARRTAPKFGQVRDVVGRSYPGGTPWFW